MLLPVIYHAKRPNVCCFLLPQLEDLLLSLFYITLKIYIFIFFIFFDSSNLKTSLWGNWKILSAELQPELRMFDRWCLRKYMGLTTLLYWMIISNSVKASKTRFSIIKSSLREHTVSCCSLGLFIKWHKSVFFSFCRMTPTLQVNRIKRHQDAFCKDTYWIVIWSMHYIFVPKQTPAMVPAIHKQKICQHYSKPFSAMEALHVMLQL